MRYDRIMLNSKKWKAKSIELIGTEKCGDEMNRPVFPSDHFGLVSELIYS